MTNKVKIFRNSLTDEEYDYLEAEANCFASLLLANPLILHKLKENAINELENYCFREIRTRKKNNIFLV